MRKSKLRISWFGTNFAFKTYYNICLLPVSVPQGQALLRGSQALSTPSGTIFGSEQLKSRLFQPVLAAKPALFTWDRYQHSPTQFIFEF